jgi:hypothetical protein
MSGWKPDIRDDEDGPLRAAVFQAIGAASTCWEEIPHSVFDSTKAKWVGDGLLAYLAKDGPLLGLATTEELFREIIARFTVAGPEGGNWARTVILAEMLGGLSMVDREYRTAEPYEQCICGAAGPEHHHASCPMSGVVG